MNISITVIWPYSKGFASRHLSWGCVVMHLSDVGKLFEQVPEGTMVVIF